MGIKERMSRGNPSRILVALLLVCSFGCKGVGAQRADENQAAAALFAQFDTVFFASGRLVSEHGSEDSTGGGSLDLLALPFTELQGALRALSANVATNLLTNSYAVLVGAKHFTAPKGLGPVHSDRCYVVISKGRKFDFAGELRGAATASVAGMRVVNWSAQLGEFGEEDKRSSEFYASQVGDVYVLIANDEEELQATAKALSSVISPNAVLDTIPEWKQFQDYEIWGYRRYKRAESGDQSAADPSFPINSAEGLAFGVDFNKDAATVNLVSSSTDEEAVLKANPATKPLVFKRQGSRVWSLTIPLAHEKAADQLYRVMSLFGFGAFV